MKYLKMLGLAVFASTALLALGGSSASATTLTCTEPAGTKVQCKAGTVMSASLSSTMTLRAGFANVTCTGSTTSDKISNAGSSTETVSGTVETLTFTNCGSFVVTIVKKGSGEVHTENNGTTANGNGTLTSTGAEVTTALGSTSCTYGTPVAKDLGTVNGSTKTGGTATITISTELSRISGGFLCANPAKLEGSYKVTSPDWLDVD